jgi:hypothetical protein
MQVIKSHFLNNEQKQLKQDIMEELINGLFGKIQINIGGILTNESASDVLVSCIIMFTRESIINLVRGSNINGSIKNQTQFVDQILGIIKQDVINQLHKELQ